MIAIMKLDILVFASHPDDAELGCAGTILKHVNLGYKVGIVDLTQGELGTRGSIEIRRSEALAASHILKLSIRENIKLADGYFSDSIESSTPIIDAIRKYQPTIIICNAPKDRHPDHAKGCELVIKSNFLAGLGKIESSYPAWRAKTVYSYIQDQYIAPDFVIDITDWWEGKVQAIKAYSSQFWNAESNEPSSYISSPDFLPFLEARAQEMGHAIGVKYGEGFVKHKQIGINSLFDLY